MSFRPSVLAFLFLTLLPLRLFSAEPVSLPALPRVPPLAPEAALKTFQIREGFSMQLLAAEPLVTDPVAGAYDEYGRLYVVEMNDYPYTDKSTDKPSVERTTDLPLGKVRVLYDDNNDGVFDRSQIFARDLSWPTGIAIYKHGVFVAGTPDCWYLKDTDEDGVADVRTKLFSGFRKLNVQAVVNNLIWGLDNHLYGAGGTNGGTIQQPLLDKKPVPLVRGDFRFDPRRPEFEILAGGARFGNTFDDFGHRFICNIRNPIQQVLLPNRYLARNPNLAVASSVHDVSVIGDQVPVYRASPPEPWRVINAARLTAQSDPLIPRSEKNAHGFMTSACGTTVYRGDAYPPQFRGQFFVGEVAANLIHREIATSDGITFTSRRVEEKAEFLTSTDNWFRPVNFIHAPDGTLHVLDMYRETIEHPWSIPDDLKQLLDLESGRDKGRIYRLAPPNFSRRPTPKLGDLTSLELVAYLEHPNLWHRETAQRLLFERQDKSVVPAVQGLLKSSGSPLGRLHALYTLSGLGALRAEDVLQALSDPNEQVRAHALSLSERFLKEPAQSALRDKVLSLQSDSSLAVRFQLAFTLGEFQDPRNAEALLTLARKDADNPWAAIAILSSSTTSAPAMLRQLAQDHDFLTKATSAPLLQQLASVVGNRNKEAEIQPLAESLTKTPDLPGVKPIVLGLQEGLKRHGRTLMQVWGGSQNSPAAGVKLVERLVERAKVEVIDPKQELPAGCDENRRLWHL
ncbi:MAG: PVC-type heme-binding CxxCH protein [Planctomycetales bacterium]